MPARKTGMPKTAKRTKKAKTPRYTWTENMEFRAYLVARRILTIDEFLDWTDELGQDWRVNHKRQSILDKIYNFNHLDNKSPRLPHASPQCRETWNTNKNRTDQQLRIIHDYFGGYMDKN